MTMYKEYNTNQLSLELNLAYNIPMNHEVRLISLFVDSIPNHVLLEDKSHTGRPAFHPAMLMKMTLFAYARQVFSGRKNWLRISTLKIQILKNHTVIFSS
ncbi:transposase [Streptococcus varani]|uniref:Transposase n=1 Tax=Streptococcus varani TaxID=1608583 RepID=A0A0E4H469_9STRE|nr:transposase [Streptococcus varani]